MDNGQCAFVLDHVPKGDEVVAFLRSGEGRALIKKMVREAIIEDLKEELAPLLTGREV